VIVRWIDAWVFLIYEQRKNGGTNDHKCTFMIEQLYYKLAINTRDKEGLEKREPDND
jgi:hypothetical protein